MPVIVIAGPKCKLAASHAALASHGMPTAQTDRRTDARPLQYAFRYRHGQSSKQLQYTGFLGQTKRKENGYRKGTPKAYAANYI